CLLYSRLVGVALCSFPTRRSSDLGAGIEVGFVDVFAVDLEVTLPVAAFDGVTADADDALDELVAGVRGRQADEFEDRVGRVLRRSEEHTSELQSRFDLVCRLLLEK